MFTVDKQNSMLKNVTLLCLTGIALSFVTHAQTLEWARSMGDKNTEWGFAIAVDDSGNVYTTGAFKDTVDFDPGLGVNHIMSVGGADIFVQKLDAAGDFCWVKSMGGHKSDVGRAITLDSLGNVYIIGSFQGEVDFDPGPNTYTLTSIGLADIYIQKLDKDGNFLWTRSIGGTEGDGNVAYDISLDATCNVYITGAFNDTLDFDPGPGVYNMYSAGFGSSARDVFILKLDTDGRFLWVNSIGSTLNDEGIVITIDDSGYVYTAGRFEGTVDFDPDTAVYSLTSNGDYDVFIQKLDAHGNLRWVKSIEGSESETITAIGVDDSGNLYTTGSFYGSIDADPGVGAYPLTTVTGAVYILKLDRDGDFLWVRSMEGILSSYGIALDALGDVYATGYFGNTVDFDPGIGKSTLTSQGGRDIFIQKLTSEGNFGWAKSIGGTYTDQGNGIIIDDNGKIYVTGSFYNTVDFDFSQGTYNLSSNGVSDIFVLKLNAFGNVGVEEAIQTSKIALYPNPSNGWVHISLSEGVDHANVHLTNALGQSVHHQTVSHTQSQLNLRHLPSGMYHVHMRLPSGVQSVGKVMLVK